MKKTLLSLSIIAFSITALIAQNADFGLKAGFNSLSIRASASGTSASESASGFYIAAFGQFGVSEKLELQPELQYISVSEDGANSDVLALPIMLKYNVAEKFSLLAGPQFDLLLDEDAEGINKLGIGLGAGAAVQLTNELFIDARYVFGLSNRLDDPTLSGVDVNFNYVQIGLGYKL